GDTGAERAEDATVVVDVEDDRLALLAADEEETPLLVERDAARAGAAVRPRREDLPRRQVDGVRLVAPLVGVGALARVVDDEGLGAVGEANGAGRGRAAPGLAGQREDLDLLRARLGDPDLARRRDVADVVRAAGEPRLGDRRRLRRIDDDQGPLAAVAG